MRLAAGTRLGAYEILSPLGRGGMGEVWRARDTKLGRDVALKTLAPELGSNPDRLARVDREARLLASLNHPNIGGIHGLEEFDGTTVLVLELVDGETLAERLQRLLDAREALDLAVQICAGLEAAHARGVIHRDLKPANIKITPDGTVKVLDFGLAKAFEERQLAADVSQSPTLSLADTRAGVILGTAGYMAPEQASGASADTRSDIFAFGIVLFEMLTRRRVFDGETVSHVLAAVLAKEPPWESLPANLHPRLRELLERCLAKKRSDRYRDIGDVRADLERIRSDPRGVIVQPSAAVPGARTGAQLAWVVAATTAACALIAAGAAWILWPAPDPRPVIRFSLPLADGQAFTGAELPMISISPDGTRVAYVAARQIFIRDLEEDASKAVAGTTASGIGVFAPTFSPDGRWLAYIDVATPGRADLKRVPIAGGTPVTIFQSQPQVGLSWPVPEFLLFATDKGIMKLPADGGTAEVLVSPVGDETLDTPVLLAGGRRIMFTRTPAAEGGEAANLITQAAPPRAQVVIQSIGGSDRRVVWEGGADARVPSGHLVYMQGTTLFAAAFDAKTGVLYGAPVPLVERVRRSAFAAGTNYALSATGTLAWIPGTAAEPGGAAPLIRTGLVWVDRTGRETELAVRLDDYTQARISPDGTRVALVVGDALAAATSAESLARQPHLWMFDLRTGTLTQLAGGATADGPLWSPDGRRLYFREFHAGVRGQAPVVSVQAMDLESGNVTIVAKSIAAVPFPLPWSITADGRTALLVNAQTVADTNIATLGLGEGGTFVSVLHDERRVENEPAISPNGAWVAYQESAQIAGPYEINIRPFPGVMLTRIPVSPGRSPVFSRDGSELFFFDGTGISGATVTYQPGLRIGPIRQLFKGAYLWTAPGRAWDVDPNGRRFLMIRRPDSAAPQGSAAPRPEIQVVVNWAEEVKSRVPVP